MAQEESVNDMSELISPNVVGKHTTSTSFQLSKNDVSLVKKLSGGGLDTVLIVALKVLLTSWLSSLAASSVWWSKNN
jgi:hypothetical protein